MLERALDRWQAGGTQVADGWQTGGRRVADGWQTGGREEFDEVRPNLGPPLLLLAFAVKTWL